MPAKTDTAKKLVILKELLDGKATMLIVLQDNPDPDAIGAAVALRRLANHLAGVQCSLTCGGAVRRAENRALVRYLDLNLRPVDQIDCARFDVIAMLDTQPGTGNNSLPADVAPQIVIDHHPTRDETRKAPLTDVRSRYGATCTIAFEYLEQADLQPDVPLATALLYGIRSDTQDLGREATAADIQAFGKLYPLANKRVLSAIQRGQVPSEYFQLLARGLDSARLHGSCICCELGRLDNPDMIAEVADLLLRHEQASWSLCWGFHNGRALLSVRTSVPDGGADDAMKKIVSRKGTGGGHRSMAGGQIPVQADTVDAQDELAMLIRRRFLKATGNSSTSGAKLL